VVVVMVVMAVVELIQIDQGPLHQLDTLAPWLAWAP
jgi:hypothetical protein